MKWLNKGHEFDDIGKNFNNQKKIFIYGAGEYGKILYDKIKFLNCVEGFIDNDIDKQKAGYCGKKVESIFNFLKIETGKYIVIVAASIYNTNLFMNQLRSAGYKDGIDLFELNGFVNYYLSIYAMYAWNKVYFHSVGLTLTMKCNLCCKTCLAFIPYNNNPVSYDIDMFKESVDKLFEYVDFVDVLQLSGGETFLYKQHSELVHYIAEKYRDRIHDFYTTTNGTLLLNDKDLMVLHESKVEVIIDDYRDTVNKEFKIEQLIQKLKEYNIKYRLNKVEYWIDLAPTTTDNNWMSDDELEIYNKACHQPWIELFDNKLYSCNYAQYAMRAGLIEDTENDSFNLANINKDRLKDLLEFRMGYTEKGYVDFCRKCSGYIAINKNIVKPAIQTEK